MSAGAMGRAVFDADGWELFDWDALTGVTRWMKQEDGLTHVRTDTPTAQLIANNHAERMEAGSRWTGDWVKIASTPADLFYQSGMDEATAQQDRAWMNRWLDDHSAFKTHDGRVG